MMLLLPLLLLLAPQAAPAAGETDVVFVVDASNSVARSDPQNFRRRALRAAADLMAERGRVRVSLLPFAGWNESADKEAAPLVREQDPAKVAKAIQDLPSFGYATDVNVAFERGLPKLLEARRTAGATGPLWFLFVSDGQFDVVEEKIRPEYEESAKKDFAKQYAQEKDVALLNAALKRFEETLKTRLAGLKVTVTGISVGKTALAEGSPFHRVLAAFGTPPRVHHFKDQPLKNVFWPLAVDSPGFRPGRDTFTGYEAQEQALWSVPLQVFPGTERVRILAWSESPDYDVSIQGLAGAKVSGEGASHRVLTVEKPAPGIYVAGVNSKGGKRVEFVIQIDAALRLKAQLAGGAVIGAGDVLAAELSLIDAGGNPVESADLLKFAKVEAALRSPKGVAEPLGLTPTAKGGWTAEAPTSESGTYALEFKGYIRLPGGREGTDLLLEPLTVTAAAAVRWEASFSHAEIWQGQGAEVRLRPLKGSAPGENAIPLTLAGPGSPSLKLEPGAARSAWTARYAGDAPGEWSLPKGILDGRLVVAGSPSNLRVKSRSLRVTRDGSPVTKIEIDAKYAEAGRYPLDLKVDVDAAPDEKIAWTSAFEGDPRVALEGKDAVPLALLLTETSPELRTGTLKIAARVAGQDLGMDLPVELRFPDYMSKMLKRWIPVILGALLLLTLAAIWAVLQRFSVQQLRMVMDDGSLGTPYLLKSWARGLTRREAVGTPEAREALRFRVKGLKPKPPACTLEKAKEGVALNRNGEPAAPELALRHGDELDVRAGTDQKLYYYFEKPPTPEEVTRIQELVCERDLIFIEEDDRLL